MIPDNLLLFYSTLSTTDVRTVDYSHILKVEMGSFFEVSDSRRLSVSVDSTPDLDGYQDKAITIEYNDYVDNSYVSSSIPCWSRFSIHSKIPVKRLSITNPLTSISHTRTITYDLSIPNPVVTHPGGLYNSLTYLNISSHTLETINISLDRDLYLYYDGPRSRVNEFYPKPYPDHTCQLFFSGSQIFKRHIDAFAPPEYTSWSDVTDAFTSSPIHPTSYSYLYPFTSVGYNNFDTRITVNDVYLLGNYINPKYNSWYFALPDAIGSCSLVTEISLPWNDKDDVSSFDDPLTLVSKSVPSSFSGYSAAAYIPTNTLGLCIESVAWGLIAAVSSKDIRVISLILRELIHVSTKRGWYKVENNRMDLASLPSYHFGFDSLDSTNPSTCQLSYKDVYSNSLLGYSICLALHELYDTTPYRKFSLDGVYEGFEDKLKLLLKGLQVFVVNSISPYSSLCSLKSDSYGYTYNLVSISASYYADMFLNSSLQFIYDLDVHCKHIYLTNKLSDLPTNIKNPIYDDTFERDYTDTATKSRPEFTYEYESHPELVDLYNRLLIVCSRLFWSLHYRDNKLTRTCFEYYAQIKEDLVNSGYSDVLSQDCHVLLAYLSVNLKSFNKEAPYFEDETLSSFFERTGVGYTTSVYIGEYPLNIPLDLLNPLEPLFLDLEYASSPRFSSLSLFPLHVFNNDYDLFSVTPFNSLSYQIKALVSKDLDNYRRMMPFGRDWFSQEKVEDIKSVIGSMLYAEANTIFKWHTASLYINRADSIEDSFGEFIDQWFTSTFSIPSGLSSMTYKKKLLSLFKGRTESNSIESITNIFKSLLNPSFSISLRPFPQFYHYRDIYVKEDIIDNYIEVERRDRGYYTKEEYLSMVYKKGEDGKWTPRRVGGFPVIDKPEGYLEIDAEDYLTGMQYRSPESKVVVRDDPIYIIPFEKYVYTLELEIINELPYLLDYLIDTFFTSGLYVRTSYISIDRS